MAILVWILLGPPRAEAQVVPSPGAISTESQRVQQEIEKRQETRIEGPAVVGPKPPEQLVLPPGGATLLLQTVVFDHSAFIPQTTLDAIAARYIGRRVDISDLQKLVKAVNDIYAARHIITSLAYLPQQDVKSGHLHVAIVEGRLGQIVVKGNRLLPSDWVTSNLSVEKGVPLDVPKLEEDVARFNATRNAQMQAALQPGASFGLTDIALSVLEPPKDSLQLFFDNQGVDSVGRLQAGANYQHYGLFGYDDKLSAYLLGAQGNQNGNLAYNFPFNPWGGRIGVSAGLGQIRVVEGLYKSLNIKGTSENEGLNIAQPLYIDPTWAVLLNGALTRSQSISTQSGIGVSNNETIKRTVGTTIRLSSDWMSANLAANVSYGSTMMKVTGTHEEFTLFTTQLASSFRMPLDFVLALNGTAQLANRATLAGDQQFQIGGPTSVRGYTPESLSGTDGYFTNLELHHSLAGLIERTDVYAFYDRGVVYNTFPRAATLNSVGAGVSWKAEKSLAADLSFGVPLTRIAQSTPSYAVYFRVSATFP